MKNPTCPYCNHKSELVTGEEVYPNRPDLHLLQFYMCKPCNAYVGCHPGMKKPLGRLANEELRRQKMLTHVVFDPLWKSKVMSRTQAYKWLADKLGIKVEDCHIGMFDEDMCRQARDACMGRKSHG